MTRAAGAGFQRIAGNLRRWCSRGRRAEGRGDGGGSLLGRVVGEEFFEHEHEMAEEEEEEEKEEEEEEEEEKEEDFSSMSSIKLAPVANRRKAGTGTHFQRSSSVEA